MLQQWFPDSTFLESLWIMTNLKGARLHTCIQSSHIHIPAWSSTFKIHPLSVLLLLVEPVEHTPSANNNTFPSKVPIKVKRLSEAIKKRISLVLMLAVRLTGPAERYFLAPEESPSAGHITRASPASPTAAVSLPACDKTPHTADTKD